MLVCESNNFNVFVANEPHVSREDGGHLVIIPKEPVENRWDLDDALSVECMQLSRLVGQSMRDGLVASGIDIRRINFQDNGNWGLDTHEGPKMHLHLYGRSANSVNQTHGDALRFPPKSTEFWKHLSQLTIADVQAIRTAIKGYLPKYEPTIQVVIP